MEGAAAAQTILGNVGQLAIEEFRQVRGVRGEVTKLRDELATMNAILRMQSEADDDAVDHFVREWMNQVRELAYDAQDCVDLYVFRVRCLLSDGFFPWLKCQLATLSLRRRLAGDIKDLRARAVDISERHARYGVNREALRRSPLLGPVPAAMEVSARALHPANDPDRFVGMKAQAVTLAEQVKAVVADEDDGDMKLKVFSIVGFGGLGKTTLAMEVCRQLEVDFQRQAQVSVSQAFDGSNKDLKGLLKRMLEQIVKPKAENEQGVTEQDPMGDMNQMGVNELAANLKQTLKDKRYLIVIDDVWTVSAWDAIKSKLPDNKCGSRIMVTTRIETVGKACSDANNIYHINPLNSEDSEKLFLSRAFGSINATCPQDLKGTMNNILRKCGGLPLAIVSIASLLASYKSSESKAMWETICRSIGSQMESNPTLEGMRQILTLSYSHLPHHLKGCMMYLSIFPEDYVIFKDRLLNRWIAEGLIVEKRGLTMIEVAETYLDELMSRSMIDPAGVKSSHADGRVETCRVHDMMLEVLVSKSLEANFVGLVGGQQYKGMSYDRIRRLSIHGGGEGSSRKTEARRGRKNGGIEQQLDVQHVRSLSMFDPEGHKLLDRLGEFTLLRVLDLEDCNGLQNKHLVDICRLYLLRFLSLKGTNITKMPPKVGDLEHLQTLNVRHTGLTELPETVTKLEKLERLMFCNNESFWDTRWNLPRGVGKMKALRELGVALLSNDVQVAEEIGELQQLQWLSLHIDCPKPEDQVVLEMLAQSLSKLYSLRCLNICHMGEGKSLDFLHGISSPSLLLRCLMISGVIDKFPNWIGSLTYLVQIEVLDTHFADDDQLFGVLCKLPNLEKIGLHNNCYWGRKLVARTTHNFPSLKNLAANCHSGSNDVYQFEKGSMAKLESLGLYFCDATKKSIVGIEHLTNLKELELGGNRSAVNHVLEQQKAERESRPNSNQFKIIVHSS